jgi:hypothetical protein
MHNQHRCNRLCHTQRCRDNHDHAAIHRTDQRSQRKHHAAMQAIFFAFYNFCRKHETLKGRTPAMAAGLAVKAWTIRERLELAAA